MKTDYFVDPFTQTMIENMPEKTGKSLEAWFKTLDGKITSSSFWCIEESIAF